MHDRDRFRILGTYTTPHVKIGAVLSCEYRDCDVIVVGYSDAKIPWPIGRRKGTSARGLVIYGELAHAVRSESNIAVAYWWGVDFQTVSHWRRALGVEQHGNYGDFRVDQTAKFSLEFYPHSLDFAESHEPLLEHISPNRYRIRGQVVYADSTAFVIDFGLMAYKYRNLPAIAANDAWVEGEIDLGVDPLFYFKELHARAGMPKLQYDWRIKSILLETTPRQHEERERRHDSDAR